MSSPQQSLTVAVLGIAIATGLILYQAIKNFNFEQYPLSVVGCVIAAYLLVAVGIQLSREDYATFWAAQHLAFWAILCAIVSICTSSLIYRTFFHPLNHFPGPFGAKLSKFWSLRQVVKSKSRWYRVCVELH